MGSKHHDGKNIVQGTHCSKGAQKPKILKVTFFRKMCVSNLQKIVHIPNHYPELERAIFQTLWRLHCCTNFLFFKLETSNFSYLLVFLFCLTNCKVSERFVNIFLDISPLFFFVSTQRGDPCKMSNINVVQSF